MKESLRAIGALALGAGAMYLLDPDRGRRRRAIVRDKSLRLANVTTEALGTTARDLQNRTRGVFHAIAEPLRRSRVDDETLGSRLRSRLGRVVSHPRAIEIECVAGDVTLRGMILERELNACLRTIRRAPGVRSVRSELEVHATADVNQLQGGRVRPGNRIDIAQEHWAPATRLLGGIAGGALGLVGARAGGPLGAIAALGGAALLARSATNIEMARMVGLGGDAEEESDTQGEGATSRREAVEEMA